MAVPRSWGNKMKISLPPHYYEGFLEKKGPWEKDYKKYWAGLRGLSLYFYNTSRDVQYVEKMDLSDFVSITNDTPPRTMATWSTEGVRATLKMKHQEVKLQMESLESREMWKGFILTIVEMKVPSTLSLLPGHIYMLSEALEKEKERRSKPELVDPRESASSPSCFFKVSRTEAELLLEKNENCGNILLRPGGDGKSISVTTRQKVNGTAIIKHYKINQVGREYVINVEEPYRCTSLNKVVEFFVTHSKMLLIPLCLDESYSMTLDVMELDKESGESSAVHPQKQAILPPTQKGVLGGEKPLLPHSCRPPVAPPPIPSVLLVKPPVPVLDVKPDNVYEEEDQPDQTYMNEDAKGAPAVVTPRNFSSSLNQRKTNDSVSSRLVMTLPRSSSAGITEELERKLKERRAILQD
ncbi:signal-transducing adaptor protein 2 [Tiliqua scincoides]|uniref:signal-transducing adaptor protein 2 n=1 Tax=Tiliqua scincoides TaxID=71010 RepID=UPI003461B921